MLKFPSEWHVTGNMVAPKHFSLGLSDLAARYQKHDINDRSAIITRLA